MRSEEKQMSQVIPPPPQHLLEKEPEIVETQTALVTKQETGLNLWTPERVQLLKSTLVPPDVTDQEFVLFVEICKQRNLNPFHKHVFAVKRGGRLVIQTSIDGYRLIAERSGKYLGQTQPYWCGSDGVWKDVWTTKSNPFASKVGVHKLGQMEPTWGIAYWDMYEAPGPFWKKGGPHMLAKVAEALALKKAFPEELSGLYTTDEMDQSTMVTLPAPDPALEQQPVLIFPSKVVNSWTDPSGTQYALIADSGANEWLFSGPFIDKVDAALDSGSPLMVYFKMETGRRVVVGLE